MKAAILGKRPRPRFRRPTMRSFVPRPVARAALAALFIPSAPAPAKDGPAPRALETATVRATRTERALDEIPAAVSRAGRESIQRATQQIAIDEALETVPGVFVLNRYNFAQDTRIAIRGFGARADFGIRGIQMIVDGIPATTPDGQGGVDGIDFGSAESIEVLRGPAAALYGAASGGVIRVRTEDGPPRPFVEARATVGEHDFAKAQFKAGGRRGALNYLVHGSRLTFGGFRENSRTENTKFNAKLGYAFGPDTELTVVANAVDIPVQDDPGGLTRAEARADRDQARARNLAFDGGERVEQQKLGWTLRHGWGERHELRVRNYYVRRDFANKLPFTDGGQVTFDRFFFGGGVQYDFSGAAWRFTAGLDAGRQIDDRQNFDNRSGARGPVALDQEETVTSLGAFVRQRFEIAPGWSVSGALRYDRVTFDVDDRFLADGDDSGRLEFDEPSPMAGIRWEARPWLTLYGNVATSFETPTTTEFDDPSGGGFNEALEPQTATSYEIGMRSRFADAPWPARFELAAFAIDIEDALVPFQLARFPDREFFRNAGSSRRTGLETSLEFNPADDLAVTVSYTYSDFEYERFRPTGDNFDGNTIPGIPRHFANIRLEYAPDAGWFARWNTRLVGELYADDANATRVDGYTVSDARLGYRHKAGGWTLEPFIGINNAFDREYNANIRINAFGGRHFEPAPGRSIYGGFRARYTFGRGEEP